MEGNSFYQLCRLKSPSSDIVVFWTGDGWSQDPNDGVLFRHAGSAEKFAKSRKWDVRKPDEFHPNRMAVEVSLATPELVLRKACGFPFWNPHHRKGTPRSGVVAE